MRPKQLVYVAGPYSGDIPQNIRNAEKTSIALIRNGFHVITPHKNTAGYEKYEGDGIDYQTWIDMGLDLLSRCDAMLVMIDSERSVGVQEEIRFCEENDIPIAYEICYPDTRSK